ncbi:ACT-toxin biosynthesis protein 5 [Alternaria alternata]|nr:ACT-toxin biosynthesis protein 5 [Alternaria alternata]
MPRPGMKMAIYILETSCIAIAKLNCGTLLTARSLRPPIDIIDIKQELIKVRGFQVAPPELEAALLQAKDDIADVAVIGLKSQPDSDAERPRAYVVRKPGSDITEAGVKRLIDDHLASYKQLTGGVVFLDEIPRSPTGKILKRVLREWAGTEEKENVTTRRALIPL